MGMAWRKLIFVLTMATLLLVFFLQPRVSVMLRGSGGGGVTAHSRLVVEGAKDSSASPAAPRDTRSRHHALGVGDASRGEHSGDGSLHHFSQARRDLETEFDRRRNLLLQGCKLHDARVALPDMAWRLNLVTRLPGPLSLCMIFKAASSTLRKVIQEVKGQIPATPRPLKAVIVRHPLARLASAYRDKFLDGKPLFHYNDEWRSNTSSIEPWDTRFVQYWLPALISTGSVAQTAEFKEMLRNIKKVYQRFINRYTSQTGVLLAHPSKEEEEFYGVKLMDIIYNMLYIGPHIGMFEACNNSYNLTEKMERFENASFTFSQFLRHVVWTHDQGMPDVHWMTYTENCDPCRGRLDYILKLETIQEEINHLFQHVLGYSEKISFPVRHHSVVHSLGHSDRQYYASVSPELMQRIVHIYRHDFALFGYKHDVY